MNISKEILKDIIENFSLDKFIFFFREKSNFGEKRERLEQYDDGKFTDFRILGEIKFDSGQKLIIVSIKVNRDLSEKSSKRAQYDIAKKILKDRNKNEAGIFIFYDENRDFRFSLVYERAFGIKRVFSNFRRFTYFVCKDQTNRTFLQRIGEGDFLSLEEIIDAFSVEKVTKEFYKDIANWYFWAVQNVKFPKDAETEENGRNIAVIRLITRIIFIWFMRERGLVPKYLFEENMLSNILKDASSEKLTYYLAILQNLFFATLNTKKTERNFQREKGFNKGKNSDYEDYNDYRYHKLFKDSTKMNEYFGDIPFLNGGLFECLDDKKNEMIVDGFSDNQKNQPQVPNYLFFSGEQEADLNVEYGTKNKSYKVRGLIKTLSFYNFTIDENDLDDQEVALDPELLGRVFENLLASFNPETSTTARKATGSYYTPREIVNYMVTESLKQYFKTHLEDVSDLEGKLGKIFSNDKDENPFKKEESERVVKLIESLRVVDPAVGSGAFPMGVLNKLVFILSKIDPQNLYWKKVQINAVKQNVVDSVVRQKLIDQIEKQFQEKNIDYGRKLFLIQKCIYGVDIQQIAVEIARLRFFISLLVNEKIDQKHPDGNWGIQPLPNLDFKLMQGNSLISEFMRIDFDKDNSESEKLFSDNYQIEETIREFEQKKSDFQSEQERSKKEKLKEDIEKLIIKILNLKLEEKFPEFKAIEEKYSNFPNEKQRKELIVKEKQEFSKIIGFNIEVAQKQLKEYAEGLHAKPFFLWKLYFAEIFQGENQGFDIVIANPPYVRVHKQNKEQKEILKKIFISPYKDFDIYIVFIEQAMKLLKENGILCFITPDKYLIREYGEKIRNYLFNYQLIEFYDVSRANDLFGAAVYPLITISKKVHGKAKTRVRITDSIALINNPKTDYLYPQSKWEEGGLIELIQEDDLNVINKITTNADKLKDFVEKDIFCGTPRARDYYGWAKGLTDKHCDSCVKVLVCQNLRPYKIDHSLSVRTLGERIKSPFFNNSTNIISPEKWNDFLSVPKILIRGNDTRITAVIDNEPSVFIGIYGIKFTSEDKRKYIKFVLALLNSNLYQWIFLKQNSSLKIGGGYFSVNASQILRLPFKYPLVDQLRQFDNIVDRLLSKSYGDNSLDQEGEKQIDQLVYKLYGLTKGEIQIVEGKNE